MFKPNYRITQTILNNIAKIAEIKAIIERAKVLPQREALLRRKAVVKMAHTSTSIEGNALAEFEVEKVLGGTKIQASQKEISEVKNYEKALLRIIQLAGTKTKISSKIILSLHSLVMTGLIEKGKTGVFRKTPVYIVNEHKDHDELAYQPPQAKLVILLINELMQWLNYSFEKKENPIITSGILHYQFETIHPFTDGNGRVGRLLTQLYLYLNGYDFRKILVLDDFYNQNRKAYYLALQTAETFEKRKGNDLTNWLEYFTAGFLNEVLKAKLKIEQLGFGTKLRDGEQVYLDRQEIKIMDFLNTTGRLISQDIVEILKIGKRASQMKLDRLLSKGIIKKIGKGPATFYTLKS